MFCPNKIPYKGDIDIQIIPIYLITNRFIMKKTWGIIIVVLIIIIITAGRLYKKYDRDQRLQEVNAVSQEQAQQLIQNQRQAEIDAQLAEQTRLRDSAYQVEKAAREQQMADLKALREQLEAEAAGN